MKAEPKYFCILSQSYFAIVWMCPNWAQTICRASWMCYLADLPFLSFSLTFFCSFLQESDGAAVVSALRFHPVTHCFSALFLSAFANRVQLNMYYMNITKHCVCVCLHACVCMGMFIPGPLLSHKVHLQPPPTPPFFVPGCFNRLNLFFLNWEAVIGVMCSR